MPTFEVEIRGSVYEVEAPNENAAVAAAQKESTLPRESGLSPTSNDHSAGIVAALGGLASAGMAAAPAIVAKAPGLTGVATAATIVNDLRRGEFVKAAEHGLLGTGASALTKMATGAASPQVARVAAGMRAASPAAAMGSVIAAGHAAKMDPRNAPKTKNLSSREIAEEEIRRLTGGGM